MLKVNTCQGDLVCWFKTHGKCPQKDDMEILTKRSETEICVFATGLYVWIFKESVGPNYHSGISLCGTA
jgi:multimeric flavodoxin WrbA